MAAKSYSVRLDDKIMARIDHMIAVVYKDHGLALERALVIRAVLRRTDVRFLSALIGKVVERKKADRR